MFGVRIFVSYAHQDLDWLRRLAKHLKVFESLKDLEIWSDRRIPAGPGWRKEIFSAIETAQVAVLLLSADFLSSEFIFHKELPRILQRHRAGVLHVIPVLVEPSAWDEVPELADLQIRPWNSVPLALRRRPSYEAELAKIAREIVAIARQELSKKSRPLTGLEQVLPNHK